MYFSQSNIRNVSLLTKIFEIQSIVFPYSFFFILLCDEMSQHTAYSFSQQRKQWKQNSQKQKQNDINEKL